MNLKNAHRPRRRKNQGITMITIPRSPLRRDLREGLPAQGETDAETDAAGSVRRPVPAADGRTAARGACAPRTPTQHSVRLYTFAAHRIKFRRLLVELYIVPIFTPFPDVAVDVCQTPRMWEFSRVNTYSGRFFEVRPFRRLAIGMIPVTICLLAVQLAAKVIWCARSATGCVLPLGLGGYANNIRLIR